MMEPIYISNYKLTIGWAARPVSMHSFIAGMKLLSHPTKLPIISSFYDLAMLANLLILYKNLIL
jgi:hypothetical protein